MEKRLFFVVQTLKKQPKIFKTKKNTWMTPKPLKHLQLQLNTWICNQSTHQIAINIFPHETYKIGHYSSISSLPLLSSSNAYCVELLLFLMRHTLNCDILRRYCWIKKITLCWLFCSVYGFHACIWWQKKNFFVGMLNRIFLMFASSPY